jgi:hypothetical protein
VLSDGYGEKSAGKEGLGHPDRSSRSSSSRLEILLQNSDMTAERSRRAHLPCQLRSSSRANLPGAQAIHFQRRMDEPQPSGHHAYTNRTVLDHKYMIFFNVTIVRKQKKMHIEF